jgi:virulence factor
VPRIRLAIIGYGHMSENTYCPLLHTFADRVELAALVEPDEQRRQAALRTYAFAHGYDEVGEMLAAGKPDAALVLTPAPTHYEIIGLLLEAGVDVYTEKPDTPDLPQARELVALAARHERVYQVGQNRLFMTALVRAKEFLGERPVDFAHVEKSKTIRRTDAAYLLDDGLHVMSPLLWLAGEVAEVLSVVHVPQRLLAAQLRLASGGAAHLVQHVDSGVWVERFLLHAAGRSAHVFSPDLVELHADGQQVGNSHVGRVPMLFATAELLGFRDAVAHFLDCLQSRQEPRGSARSLLRVHEVMAEVFRLGGIR